MTESSSMQAAEKPEIVENIPNILQDLWWIRLPALVGIASPAFARQCADGAYLAAWPLVARFLPALCLLVGLTEGALHFSGGPTFTASILVMSAFVILTSLGAGLGALLCIGYAITDFAYFPHGNGGTYLVSHAALLIAYFLLFQLLATIPYVSKGLRRSTFKAFSTKFATTLAAVLQGGLSGVFTYFWAQGSVLLIRPIFVWPGGDPRTADIYPLQNLGWVLALVAAAAAFLQVLIERRSVAHKMSASYVTVVEGGLSGGTNRIDKLPQVYRLPLKAICLTFVVSGMLSTWLQSACVFVGFIVIFWIIEGSFKYIGFIFNVLMRVPILTRVIFGAVTCGLLGRYVIQATWSTSIVEFLPIILGTFVSLLVMTILIPESIQLIKGKKRE